MPRYRVIEAVRVRMARSVKGRSVQWLRAGQVIDGQLAGVADRHEWVAYTLTHEGIEITGYSAIKSFIDGTIYMVLADHASMLPQPIPESPAPQPQPAPVIDRSKPWHAQSDAYLHGIHELCCGKAREAHANGVKALMYFNNAVDALQDSVAHADAICMHRIYFNQPIDPLELLKQHAINPDETSRSRAWLRGLNEYDVPGFGGSPEDIKRRAEFDEKAARALRKAAPDAVWIGGGFPHGCPDVTSGPICDALRTYYAPLYNSGLIAFDMHNYSKSEVGDAKNYRRIAPVWLERRWEFLFTKCGFDPRIRMIVSTETGLEGPGGGFAQQGFTHDEFMGWCSYYSGVQRTVLQVDGRDYPSPFIASTHFQAGGAQQGRWMGYEMQGYLPVVYERARMPAGMGVGDENVYAGVQLETGYVPARKQLIEQPGLVSL